MKSLFFLYTMLLSGGLVFGQAQDGVITYNKTQQPAVMISLFYPPDVVNAALDTYLSGKGSKSDDVKGFKTFRNTRLAQGDSTNADLYLKVIRKSRSEKDESVVYLLMGTPNEGTATNTQVTHFTSDQAKAFLNNLSPVVAAYSLETRIKEQNETVIKEEKKYKNLMDDGNDLNKKKSDIERKITDNKNDQDKQTTEVEKQKQALSLLISQRKS